MSTSELVLRASLSGRPEDRAENGKAYRKLATAILMQALKDAEDGVDLNHLAWVWKDSGQVGELCEMSGIDLRHYREKLEEILGKRKQEGRP